MADWPLLRNSLVTEDDAALSSYGVTITASGSANTKGAYTQLVASLPRACSGILLQLRGNSGVYTLFDLAIGGAGSEIVVVPDLHGSVSLASNGDSAIYIPISLPAGVRVSARVQAGGGGNTLIMKAHFIADTFTGMQPVVSRYENWGADLTLSRGTTVVTSGSVNTKGSWVQLVAASAKTTKWLLIAIQIFGTGRNFAIDIGMGGAGSEQVLFSNLKHQNASLGLWLSLPFSIPGGSRVAARAASDVGSSTALISVLGGT